MPTYLSPGVYVEEVAAGSRPIEGVGTAVAAFVGLAGRGPFNTPTLVSNWTQFTSTFGDFVAGSYLAHAVYGYFMNGGGNCYVVRIGQDGVGATATAAPGRSERRRRAAGAARPATGSSRSTRRPAPGEITVEIDRRRAATSPREDMFKLVVKQGGQVVEEFDRATAGRGKQNVATMVNAASKLIQHRGDRHRRGSAKPDAGSSAALAPPPPPAAVPSPRLTADDYVGDVADRTGFGGLEAVDEITMVCVPGPDERLPAGRDRPRDGAGRAAGDDRALRADGRPGRDPRPAARAERPADQGMAGGQGRLRLEVRRAVLAVGQGARPADRAATSFVPPSGHMAGIWGRNDDTRGVHKAPANEVVRGAVDARDADHQERARPAQPGRHQLHPGLPGPAASGSGARARCPRTRPGAT